MPVVLHHLKKGDRVFNSTSIIKKTIIAGALIISFTPCSMHASTKKTKQPSELIKTKFIPQDILKETAVTATTGFLLGSLTGMMPFEPISALFTWFIERKTRKELISSMTLSFENAQNLAWIASWAGYWFTWRKVYMPSLSEFTVMFKTLSEKPEEPA
jgi:hypothetical protein